jgi:hypothetical protein
VYCTDAPAITRSRRSSRLSRAHFA